ncbi:bifunctional molybdenum cofactor biosynthesis protein MoaC/MoaB [bacterium]|nr:bifunctional molybdenum cofactor biosynthesis protein MoaC/MoaB [bacterium]
MLDVSNKHRSLRIAVAEAVIAITPSVLDRVKDRTVPKGDPLEVARVAAIMAAKRTSEIIPFCHPLPIEFSSLEHTLLKDRIVLTATVKGIYRTGMEMEAMTAASVAALTVYDMLKMLDENMEILSIRLVKKRGGKSDFKEAFTPPLRAAVLVLSDSVAGGKKSDTSGLLIRERLEQNGLNVQFYDIIADDIDQIVAKLTHYSDSEKLDLVVTTGGTGFSPRDTTPEAMRRVVEKDIPGIPEAIRGYGQERTPYAMLSRSAAGIRGNTLMINLPGSSKGVQESLDALFPAVLHAFQMMWGGSHDRAGRKA